MQTTRIFPGWGEIDEFPTALEPGERALARFLDDNLPEQYRIYVQPWINSQRHPDIVVTHEQRGVMIYEVKDWKLERYTRSNGRLCAREAQKPVGEPESQAKQYAKTLFNDFLSIDESTRKTGEPSNCDDVCGWRVYFHGVAEASARRLFPQMGAHLLCEGNLTVEGAAPLARCISPNQAMAIGELHRFLQPIANQASADRPRMTKRQMDLATPSVGFHRTRGVAG